MTTQPCVLSPREQVNQWAQDTSNGKERHLAEAASRIHQCVQSTQVLNLKDLDLYTLPPGLDVFFQRMPGLQIIVNGASLSEDSKSQAAAVGNRVTLFS